MKNVYNALPDALLPWYAENKRQLPWRGDTDPYHIWLSEIMLQQTRVEAVRGYYTRFLDALPTIESLAKAEDELLHKLWEGLGYYSRVRNLKKAALRIMEEYKGKFPRKYEQILALPGIGEYTAGAICSIAFQQPTPAVDGNVLRVVSRLTDDDTPIDRTDYKKAVRTALAEIYPSAAGDFTQALMELGATVCGPNRKPDCQCCPCRGFCLASQRGRAEKLPVKTPKAVRKEKDLTVFILDCEGRFALEKRPDTGLLAGLWQFPNVPQMLDVEAALDTLTQMGFHPVAVHRQVERKHIFTHIQWNMRGFYITVSNTDDKYTWLTGAEIRSQRALPTAFRQFLEEIDSV